MAACKRAIRAGLLSGRIFAKSRGFSDFEPSQISRFSYRQFCQLQIREKTANPLQIPHGNRAFLVDTLALVRRLEAQGVPSKQAEAITSVVTEVLNDSLENISHSFVSVSDMEKTETIQDTNISRFRTEVQSSQDHHFALLQRETEKLHGDIEKLRHELKYEIDKVTAGQRLDLNLERSRIRDEVANQKAETTNLTNKLDREIHELRAGVETAKYEVIKYCMGTLLSLSAVGAAILRISQMG